MYMSDLFDKQGTHTLRKVKMTTGMRRDNRYPFGYDGMYKRTNVKFDQQSPSTVEEEQISKQL